MTESHRHSATLRLLAASAALGVTLSLAGSPAAAQGINFKWLDGKGNLSFDEISKLKGVEQTKKFIEDAKKLADLGKKADGGAKAFDEFEKLDPADDDYDPDFNPPGTPELPLMCKDSGQCEECFKGPHQELNHLRFRFEKLRKVNRVTKKMLRENIAWGDAAAGLAGGLTPLAWESEKTKIRQSEANFNASYDAKYDELTASLLKVLQEIAACEEKVFGEQGWYERYGFMYYQFMADAYRRPD